MSVVVSLPVDHESRDIGELAVWTATSAKSGNGVDLLRDGRDDTYWQSDGTQPHVITLSFQRKVFMKKLAMLLDYRMDESYTPSKILVRVGDSLADLYDLRTVELAQPQGWAVIPLALDEDGENYAKAWMLQVVVQANHQNGKDTHVRQLRVFGPRQLGLLDPCQAKLSLTAQGNYGLIH
ncbi:subunit 10 of anaphase-promoting complex [Helicosporidium sp. ATCC 50920]|nr:subunit 10 of anaphase-promoting complex [Helicosporidium sp. ATCC 50920]|eukprot:KDD74351.1 subunit 10 of anaphase-promoting complex [Helicosporidium sp. ATCC 50920]